MTTQRRPCGECESCRWGATCPSTLEHQGDALTDPTGGRGTLWRRTDRGYERVHEEPAPVHAVGTPTMPRGPETPPTSPEALVSADLDDRDLARLVAALLRRLARRETHP